MPRAISIRHFLPLLPFLAALNAHAADHYLLRNCSAAGGVDAHLCDLSRYLPTLYAIAAVLAFILVAVIVAAVVYYRRAKNMKLEP